MYIKKHSEYHVGKTDVPNPPKFRSLFTFMIICLKFILAIIYV